MTEPMSDAEIAYLQYLQAYSFALTSTRQVKASDFPKEDTLVSRFAHLRGYSDAKAQSPTMPFSNFRRLISGLNNEFSFHFQMKDGDRKQRSYAEDVSIKKDVNANYTSDDNSPAAWRDW